MTKLEKLITLLDEELMITSVYTGGGDEPCYLSFELSEGVDPSTKIEYIKRFAEYILDEIEA